jgi:hypothetical protein
MTPPDRDGGDVACEAAAAAAVDDIDRGVDPGACWVALEPCVVCLLGCCADALALESDDGWRKAAKKVERKKGRWEDMLPHSKTSCAGGALSKSIPSWERSGPLERFGWMRRLRRWCDIFLPPHEGLPRRSVCHKYPDIGRRLAGGADSGRRIDLDPKNERSVPGPFEQGRWHRL